MRIFLTALLLTTVALFQTNTNSVMADMKVETGEFDDVPPLPGIIHDPDNGDNNAPRRPYVQAQSKQHRVDVQFCTS